MDSKTKTNLGKMSKLHYFLLFLVLTGQYLGLRMYIWPDFNHFCAYVIHTPKNLHVKLWCDCKAVYYKSEFQIRSMNYVMQSIPICLFVTLSGIWFLKVENLWFTSYKPEFTWENPENSKHVAMFKNPRFSLSLYRDLFWKTFCQNPSQDIFVLAIILDSMNGNIFHCA